MEDGDQDGEAPDSDEEKEMQRAARMRQAQAEASNTAGGNDMPNAKVSPSGTYCMAAQPA